MVCFDFLTLNLVYTLNGMQISSLLLVKHVFPNKRKLENKYRWFKTIMIAWPMNMMMFAPALIGQAIHFGCEWTMVLANLESLVRQEEDEI